MEPAVSPCILCKSNGCENAICENVRASAAIAARGIMTMMIAAITVIVTMVATGTMTTTMTDFRTRRFEALFDVSAMTWILGGAKKGAIFRPIRRSGAIATLEGGRTHVGRLPPLSRHRAFTMLPVQ